MSRDSTTVASRWPKVVAGDGLDRGDRAGLGRRDPLLQPAHFLGQRRLVAHGRRHPPQQRRNLGPGEREAVDVVDEQQHVATLVAERLGDRETGQRDAQPVARRLVHLAVHHRHLGLRQVVLVDDARLHHLVVEVVPLAGALADAGENRKPRVRRRDVVDELHHRDGLAHAGAAEETHLAPLCERADEVDDLDAGLEQLLRRREFLERRRGAVDAHRPVGIDRSALVDRASQHVHDAPQRPGAHRDLDPGAGVDDLHAAAQAVGAAERDGAHDAVAQLLLHFQRQPDLVHLEGVVDLGHVGPRELHIDDRADALDDGSLAHVRILRLLSL
jgi:hypothetical protein